MPIKSWLFIFIALVIATPGVSFAQRVSVSTDPIKWVTLTPNLGVEVSLNEHYSVGVNFSAHPKSYIFSRDISAKHLSINPEARYWFVRQQYGHYVGVGYEFMFYDIRWKEYAFEGMINALSFSYGYSFIVNRHWSVTPYIGGNVGLNREASSEYSLTERGDRSFVAYPSKFGVAITYILR